MQLEIATGNVDSLVCIAWFEGLIEDYYSATITSTQGNGSVDTCNVCVLHLLHVKLFFYFFEQVFLGFDLAF